MNSRKFKHKNAQAKKRKKTVEIGDKSFSQKKMKFNTGHKKTAVKKTKKNFVSRVNECSGNGNIKVLPAGDNASEQWCTKHLLIKPGLKWFEQRLSDCSITSQPSDDAVSSLKAEAEKLFSEEVKNYKKYLEKRKEKSDFAWMQNVLRMGTLSDKISAHILLIQDSSVHNIYSIESLIGMVNTKGKRECLMALDALQDLFLSNLLIENKKLITFDQHPLMKLGELASGNLMSRNKRLILWLFEDRLKALYSKFLKNLELVSHDTVEKTKQKAVTIMYELLKNNPEQEQFLLEHLVNKIGDPIPKVGSHACYLLGQIVNYHRRMISVVVQEVERLLFRQNIADRAKYYCLCFLNQLILNRNQSDVANNLISIYFGQFKLCIKKGEVNTKMMSALLSGVSRAYPYAKLQDDIILKQLDSMYKLVHLVSFNISVQALMLIFQVLDSKDSVSDRYYSALYRKLLDSSLSSSSKQSMLLNLIFRALKKDPSKVRVKAFVKRLLQVCLYHSPNLQCAILLLISALTKIHSDLTESQTFVLSSDSEEEECYEDIVDDDEATLSLQNEHHEASQKTADKSSHLNNKPSTETRYSWLHRQNQSSVTKKARYDPLCRNPLHAGAEFCNLWELYYLKKSYHPSVALFANQLLKSETINYNGDPLNDFTIIKFLDRFVYRNPKKIEEHLKHDIQKKVFGQKKLKASTQQLPVTSDAYIKQNVERIPVEERFIYRYLCEQASKDRRKTDNDSDIESVTSEDFEALLNEIHPEDEGRDTLNFAKELASTKEKTEKKKKKVVDSDKESDVESLQSESEFEDELNFSNDEEFKEAFYDEDIEDFEQNDADNLTTDSKKTKLPYKKCKKDNKSFDENLLASADQFAALLEDNTDLKMNNLSSEAFVNKDKASVKQLAWEEQRDKYVRGTDWKSRKYKKPKKKFRNKKK